MNLDLVAANLLNPPVLFFFLGLVAVWVGSDLDIPQPLPKFFSIYLLVAIGFKGGAELAHGGLSGGALAALGAAVAAAFVVPFAVFFMLRRRLGPANAAGVAATYGSVSAVTFIAATTLLGALAIPFGGHMVAALALMESPAIIVAVALYRLARPGGEGRLDARALLRESLLNGSVFLLVGSLVIGAATGEAGARAMAPFTGDMFRGMLALFLLDMGLVSARRLGDLRALGAFGVTFATLVPLVNAGLAIVAARLLGLPAGDAFLFCVLCASASYIAVPAALRHAIPESNPGLYVGMALGLTFPFNILIGLPLYLAAIRALWG